jgi:hypothetical protein
MGQAKRKEGYRGKQVLRNGKWEDGAATPELLPEHMRGLPGEWLTKEEAHPNNIHTLDPPHIVGALIDEHVKKLNDADKSETPDEAVKKLPCAQPGEVVPLSQWEIDIVRMRVLRSLVKSAIAEKKNGGSPNVRAIQHLRFEENNVNNYALHAGNPPSDQDRLPHERGFQLAIDVLHWPERIVELLQTKGHDVPNIEKLLEETTQEQRIIQ